MKPARVPDPVSGADAMRFFNARYSHTDGVRGTVNETRKREALRKRAFSCVIMILRLKNLSAGVDTF